jgi:chemotaxis protein MotB
MMAYLPLPEKKPEKPLNHERWVISYADLLTLLLATFVVLYASSTRNKHKVDQIAASFVKAFNGAPPAVVTASSASKGIMQHLPAAVPKPVETPAAANAKLPLRMAHQLAGEMASLQALQLQLKTVLQPLIDHHQVSIQSQPLTLTIQLDASVLFASGQATLTAPGKKLLNQVGSSLVKMPPLFSVVVQGFTDNQPIATPEFSSNWSLSAERAVRVVELFASDGVNGGQLAAQGFGQFAPIADNATDTGRQQNRRVVVVVHAPEPDGK